MAAFDPPPAGLSKFAPVVPAPVSPRDYSTLTHAANFEDQGPPPLTWAATAWASYMRHRRANWALNRLGDSLALAGALHAAILAADSVDDGRSRHRRFLDAYVRLGGHVDRAGRFYIHRHRYYAP